jgi:hypothetical protein
VITLPLALPFAASARDLLVLAALAGNEAAALAERKRV